MSEIMQRENIYLVWNILIIFSLLETLKADAKCELNINDCNYKLTLLPSNNCWNNTVIRSRPKRSEENGQEISDIANKLETLQSEFSKMQHKLVKEMNHLSKRVLRGARRVELLAEDAMPKGQGKKKSKCPQGFESFDDWNDCYLFSTFNTTWYDARDYCQAMDSDLVGLQTRKEQFLVAFKILNHPEYRDAKSWWTSGTYVPSIKKWMWMNTINMLPFDYTKWAVNEPNDHLNKNLQCVMMYKLDDLLWHDQICTDKYNFICEKPAS